MRLYRYCRRQIFSWFPLRYRLLTNQAYEVELAYSNGELLYEKPELNRKHIESEFATIFRNEFVERHGVEISAIRDDATFKAEQHMDLLIDLIDSGAASYDLNEKVDTRMATKYFSFP